MPVPDQGPAAQAGHACYRTAALPAPDTTSPRATAPCAIHDGGPPCQGRPRPSTCRRGTRRLAGLSRARRRSGAGGWMIGLGLGTGGMAGECTVGRLPILAGEVLAAAIIVVPLLTGTILVTVVVFGSTESSDRIFRLLRWFSDKEEPPAPRPVTTRNALSAGRSRTGRSACATGRIRYGRCPH
jgi:hypothetical protein